MIKFGMVFLMLATLLVSCSDSEKTGSEQSVASDSAKVDSDALACVNKGDKYGFINQAGEFVINPQFDSAGSFFNVHKTFVIP